MLSSSVKGWDEFSEKLKTDHNKIILDTDFDPHPYDCKASMLEVVTKEDSSKILIRALEDNAIEISGCVSALNVFISNVQSCASADSPGHFHFDSISFEDVVDANAWDMVFVVL